MSDNYEACLYASLRKQSFLLELINLQNPTAKLTFNLHKLKRSGLNLASPIMQGCLTSQ